MEGWVGFAVAACGAVAGCAGALHPSSPRMSQRCGTRGWCFLGQPGGVPTVIRGLRDAMGSWGNMAALRGGPVSVESHGTSPPLGLGLSSTNPRVGGLSTRGTSPQPAAPTVSRADPILLWGPPPRLQGLQQTCAADSCLGQFLCDALRTWDRHQVPPPRGRASGAPLVLPAGWGLSSQGTYNLWLPIQPDTPPHRGSSGRAAAYSFTGCHLEAPERQGQEPRLQGQPAQLRVPCTNAEVGWAPLPEDRSGECRPCPQVSLRSPQGQAESCRGRCGGQRHGGLTPLGRPLPEARCPFWGPVWQSPPGSPELQGLCLPWSQSHLPTT